MLHCNLIIWVAIILINFDSTYICINCLMAFLHYLNRKRRIFSILFVLIIWRTRYIYIPLIICIFYLIILGNLKSIVLFLFFMELLIVKDCNIIFNLICVLILSPPQKCPNISLIIEVFDLIAKYVKQLISLNRRCFFKITIN